MDDKSSWGGLATAGFFGLFLPGLLGGLLYLGVPTAQVWDLDSASSFWNQDVNYILSLRESIACAGLVCGSLPGNNLPCGRQEQPQCNCGDYQLFLILVFVPDLHQ